MIRKSFVSLWISGTILAVSPMPVVRALESGADTESAIQSMLLGGSSAGEILGIQSWHGYRRRSADSPVQWTDERVLSFYLPTLQYFAELPFRLLGAELAAYGGERSFENRAYDLVLVTWGSFAPNPDYDQYVLWIDRASGLIAMCNYTVREGGLGLRGTIHFEDYCDTQGVLLPFRQTVALAPPEQTVRPLDQNFFHRILIREARFDTVAPDQLVVDRSLPSGDFKPKPN